MSPKRMILLAAVSLTAFLLNADPGNRVLAQQPAARPQTLSEIYRNSGDIALQNKVAPFKVFDNLYHVGPGYVDAWLIPTSAGIIMIDTAEEPYQPALILAVCDFCHARPLYHCRKDLRGLGRPTASRAREPEMVHSRDKSRESGAL